LVDEEKGRYIPLRLPGYFFTGFELSVSRRYTFSRDDRIVAFGGD